MKALPSDCADCVLARKDAQAFGNLGEMRKKAVRPVSEFLQRSQLCAARCDRLSTVSSLIAVRRKVYGKVSQACLNESFRTPPCIGMVPIPLLGRMTCVQEDSRLSAQTADKSKNLISSVPAASKYPREIKKSHFIRILRPISTALYKKNRISGVHHAEKYG